MGFFKKISQVRHDSVMHQIDLMLRSFTKVDEELFEELEEIQDHGRRAATSKICEELRARVKERKGASRTRSRSARCCRKLIAEQLEGGQELQLNTKPSVILVIEATASNNNDRQACGSFFCRRKVVVPRRQEHFPRGSGGPA